MDDDRSHYMADALTEGSVTLKVRPTGKDRGPGIKGGVFYNPAMRFNRDLSVIVLQALIDTSSLPGKGTVRIVDGLCGTGIRALRWSREVEGLDETMFIEAVDTDERSLEAGIGISTDRVRPPRFIRNDLRRYLLEARTSYIDIDPFGSPVPFLSAALSSVLPGGVIAFTATDTAALCGSAPRVSRRRYGVRLVRTDQLKEVSCRVLMGYVARQAASLDLSAEPLLFFASDHYVRGYVRVQRGARKADGMLDLVRMATVDPPNPPGRSDRNDLTTIGPLWMGDLEKKSLLDAMEAVAESRDTRDGPIEDMGRIKSLIHLCLQEHGLTPFGYDCDSAASHLSTSPPRMDRAIGKLREMGYRATRSRFGCKLIRTDAPWTAVGPIFMEGR